MNKRKTTKKSFIIAAVSFMLTVLLMMGATFAWFTASRTSGANTVKTADFNVTLQYSNDFSTWTDLTDASVLFDNVTLVPGENTGVKYLKITNNNDYAVKGSMSIGEKSIKVNNNELTNTELTFYKTAYNVSAVVAPADLYVGEGTSLYSVTDILSSQEIAARQSYIVAIGVALPTTATTPNVTAKFKITLAATQADS